MVKANGSQSVYAVFYHRNCNEQTASTDPQCSTLHRKPSREFSALLKYILAYLPVTLHSEVKLLLVI